MPQAAKAPKVVVVKAPPAEKKEKKKKKKGGYSANWGATIGSLLGGRSGEWLGGIADKFLSTISGHGDYKEVGGLPYEISHNTLMQTPVSHQIPQMMSQGHATRVTHREYCFDVSMTDAFNNTLIRFAPNNVTLFPWLSQLAQSYEQYKWLGLVFEFRSLSANALAASAAGMGSVTMATQYNVYENQFYTKAAANNAMFATSCKPSESMFHPVECDPMETPMEPLYITHPWDILGGDNRMTEMGQLNLITQGAPTFYPACGELWVTYDLLLFKPAVVPSFIPETPPKPSLINLRVVNDRVEKKEFMKYSEVSEHLSKSAKAAPPRDDTLRTYVHL